jgi:putative nucleotidyltransferase with HDIG domain
MDKYGMLDNIKAHSIVVARVAYVITLGLSQSGSKISEDLILAGALLHDIGKTEALKSRGDHVKIGQEICREEGFEELVPIVAEHVVLKSFSGNGGIREKEVVYYSDKRVNHDQIVPLDKRLEYILERYASRNPQLKDAIVQNFETCKRVEAKLFQHLGFQPSEIEYVVRKTELPENLLLLSLPKRRRAGER